MQSKQGYLYFIFFPLFFVASVFIPLNSFSQKAISPDSAISQASSLLYSDPYKVKIFVDSVLADNSHEISSKTKARAYGIIAKSKYLLGDYPAALEYALKYLKTIRNVGNELNLEADALNILGVIYQAQNDYSKSIGYYSESLKLREQMNDKKLIAASLGNIGMVYQEMKKPEQSIEYLLKAKKILESLNNKYELANTLNSLSNIYLDAGQLDSAYKSINMAIKIKTEIGDSSTLTVAYCNLAGILSDMKRINEAELFYRKSIALANQLGNKNTLRSAYDYFSEFFEKTGRPDSALHYSRLFKILNESLFNSEKASQIAELQIKFNNEQKEKLRDLEQKAKDAEQKVKVNRLQFLIASSIIILLITLLFSFFIYRGYRNKKKAHEEISKKNEIIESKSKEIIDSINYAKHLQDAILPPHKLIREHLPSYFILYKPKDIVAGDFYWFEKIKDSGQILIAAADCTGHGVPGAMVSVVCSNALNRTVKEFKITQPGKILDKVRELVVETFEKSESEVKDGMDISIASFLMDEMKLEWAGANNPLWIIRSGELIEYKADKQSVGKTDHSEIFTNQSILLKKNDTIYLFSDGYADQFGGDKGKKFKTSKMKELFLSVQNETMEDQQMLIDRAFESWKGNNDQVDDVCIIGIRI